MPTSRGTKEKYFFAIFLLHNFFASSLTDYRYNLNFNIWKMKKKQRGKYKNLWDDESTTMITFT